MLVYAPVDQALAQFEGYGKAGTIATLQNNPGNLAYGTFAKNHGAIGAGTNGLAVFPSPDAGMSAEDALVAYYADQGATLQALVNAWAPPNAPGNTPAGTQSYLDFVTSQLGAGASTLVSAFKQGSAPGTPQGTGGITLPPLPKLPSIGDILGGVFGTGVGMEVPGLGVASSIFGWSRIAAFIAGLILIAGGIYLFKPVQNVVVGSAKKGIAAIF